MYRSYLLGATTISIMSSSITTLSIKGIFVTLSIKDTQFNKTVILLRVVFYFFVVLNVMILRFIHTCNVDLASDAISIETLPSFQIAIAGDSDNM
jgi:hypothetical protein